MVGLRTWGEDIYLQRKRRGIYARWLSLGHRVAQTPYERGIRWVLVGESLPRLNRSRHRMKHSRDGWQRSCYQHEGVWWEGAKGSGEDLSYL